MTKLPTPRIPRSLTPAEQKNYVRGVKAYQQGKPLSVEAAVREASAGFLAGYLDCERETTTRY